MLDVTEVDGVVTEVDGVRVLAGERCAFCGNAMPDDAEHLCGVRVDQVPCVFPREKLDRWAWHMAARFGGEVRLVGSALRKEHPRDVDVRIVIPDAGFIARYGSLAPFADGDACWWTQDMAKLTYDVVKRERINLDFQVQPAQWGRQYAHAPKVVLAHPYGWTEA